MSKGKAMLNLEAWQSVAEDALSVLVVEQYLDPDTSAFTRAFHERGLMPYHFPDGVWKECFHAVMSLRLAGRAINWQTLSTTCGALMSETFYTNLVTLYDAVRVADFPETVTTLIETGTRALAISALEQGVTDLRNGDDYDSAINTVVSEVTMVGEKRIENETAGGARTRLDVIFESEPPPMVSTGFEFVDEIIGGLREERMLVLAGPYKSRKTTCALNMILSAYRAGKRPAVLSFENSIEVTEMQIVSMLAIEWLLKQEKVPYAPTAPLYWISPDGLLQAGKGYRNWTKLKVDAIDYARAELDQIGDGIRFYDRSQQGGSLSNTLSIQAVVQRDMRLFGGNLFMIDHQGLVQSDGEIYESTRSVTNFFQPLSRLKQPHSIHLMVLAQLSEEGIKSKSAYSPGIKGGGDTPANADYVIRNLPILLDRTQGKYDDLHINMQIKQNRWGATTGLKKQTFHPESGLHLTDELMAWHREQARQAANRPLNWMPEESLPPDDPNDDDSDDDDDEGTDVPADLDSDGEVYEALDEIPF